MVDELNLSTSDGETLQAEMHVPDAPRAAVVVSHPNPLMGGDMYTPVPAAFYRSAVEHGAATVRFNFRGVGKSTGTHDKGQAEQLDVAAAIDTVTQAAPDVPLLLCGWSFGADVILASADERVAGWFLAAAPLKVLEPATMAARSSAAPKVFAVPQNDQFAPPASIESATNEGWGNVSIEVIGGADHFFGSAMPNLVTHFTTFLKALT